MVEGQKPRRFRPIQMIKDRINADTEASLQDEARRRARSDEKDRLREWAKQRRTLNQIVLPSDITTQVTSIPQTALYPDLMGHVLRDMDTALGLQGEQSLVAAKKERDAADQPLVVIRKNSQLPDLGDAGDATVTFQLNQFSPEAVAAVIAQVPLPDKEALFDQFVFTDEQVMSAQVALEGAVSELDDSPVDVKITFGTDGQEIEAHVNQRQKAHRGLQGLTRAQRTHAWPPPVIVLSKLPQAA
jgi:hypothetical protein